MHVSPQKEQQCSHCTMSVNTLCEGHISPVRSLFYRQCIIAEMNSNVHFVPVNTIHVELLYIVIRISKLMDNHMCLSSATPIWTTVTSIQDISVVPLVCHLCKNVLIIVGVVM